MEELASLIPLIIIGVITAIANSSKNKSKQQQQQTVWQPAAASPAPAQPVTRPAAPAQPVRPVQHTVAQPTVHTHLDPDCDTHDAPASGSLNVVSPEGKDPCHEQQLPQRRAPVQEDAAEQPGLALDFSGDAMVRAFVMQEVLTRPCDRRRPTA